MNSRGKKVLDIEWKREGLEIKVPVKAFYKTDYNTSEKNMVFRATYPDAGIDLEGADINVIRRSVVEKLDEWYTVKWELFFVVEIDGGPSGHGKNQFNIEFDMEFFVVGKDSRGKTRHMRIPRPSEKEIAKFDGKPTQWGGEQPKDGEPETGTNLREKGDHNSSRYYHGERAKLTRSLVRATPANVAAADQFTCAMQTLLDKMHHHFAPERIEALLQNTALLLPAPKGKDGR
jgi:hypothetical protein